MTVFSAKYYSPAPDCRQKGPAQITQGCKKKAMYGLMVETAGDWIRLCALHGVVFLATLRVWTTVFGVRPRRACLAGANLIWAAGAIALRSWLVLVGSFVLAAVCVGIAAYARRVRRDGCPGR